MAKILGIDVGSNTGYYISDDPFDHGSVKLKKTNTFIQSKGKVRKRRTNSSVLSLYNIVESLVKLHSPDIIVTGIPTFGNETFATHYEYIGILKLICEQNNIELYKVIDSSCKFEATGKGNADKEYIMNWSNIDNEHASDAKMFTVFLHNVLNGTSKNIKLEVKKSNR